MFASFNRQPMRPKAERMRQKMAPFQFPAPVRGWIENESLAFPQPGGASLLENWFPTATSIRLRGGCVRHATLDDTVESLFAYRAGSQRMFGSDETSVYDITAPVDPDVAPTADITGQTSGYYSNIQFTTSGGDFLYILNGTDDPQLYDGAAWIPINGASTPSITGVTSADLIQGTSYRNRLFFIEKLSLNVWYPAVGALGGLLENITLAGIFKRGGVLLFCSTWSTDSGDGLDDKFVVVSTEGEIAVFQGANPSGTTEADWFLVGVYTTSRPLGKNAWLSVGGDLLILTEEGIMPMSEIISKDPAALSLSAISKAIEPAWKAAVSDRRSAPWEIVKWPEKNMAIISVPQTSAAQQIMCFVVNLETGAWAKYTGWDARTIISFDGRAFFGATDGRVRECETGGNDDGLPYVCRYIGLFEQLQLPGMYKSIRQGRPNFIATEPFNPDVTVCVNYDLTLPAPPNSVENYSLDVWDQGLWDVALWDNGTSESIPTFRWVSIDRAGFAIAPALQVTCGVTPTPGAELLSMDITFETGAMVV